MATAELCTSATGPSTAGKSYKLGSLCVVRLLLILPAS